MRKVAAFLLTSRHADTIARDARFDEVLAIVGHWFAEKGKQHPDDPATKLILHDGRVATLAITSLDADGFSVRDFCLTEPSREATIRTQVSVGRLAAGVVVYIELQAAGADYTVGPLRLEIWSPRILRMLVEKFDDWFVGESPIQTVAFPFKGAKSAADLHTLIALEQRNLPVVVVSQFEGHFLSPGLPNKLAAALAGLAIVAWVDAECSWEFTNHFGQAWSCLNGAVRMYWPPRGKARNPLGNPVWTRASLLAKYGTESDAADAMIRQLSRELFGLSTFVVPEPVEFEAVRSAHSRAKADAERAELEGTAEWQGLAMSYSEENEGLRKSSDALREEVSDLKAQLSNLKLSYEWKPDADPESNDLAPDQLPPNTVAQAVQRAREELSDFIVFGADVDKGIETLEADSGPPDKVLRYLQQVADMVRKRRTPEGLGTVPSHWFEDNNVSAGLESESVKRSPSDRKKRTWDAGGADRFFDLHLKPSDGVHPNRCVRIYLDYDDPQKKAVIGWVGRHPN